MDVAGPGPIQNERPRQGTCLASPAGPMLLQVAGVNLAVRGTERPMRYSVWHYLVALCLHAALMPPNAVAAAFPIASGGKLLPSLVVAPEVPTEVALDLQRILTEITGGAVETSTVPPSGPAILVGDKTAAMFGDHYAELSGPDTFRIALVGEVLHLAGATPEAAVHAVYTFLHDLGCRWYVPGGMGEVLPHDPNLAWTGKARTETPSFYFRELWWAYGGPPETAEDFRVWRQRNRLGGRRIAHGHNLTNTVAPATYFDEHPEYYALVGGKRQTTQLCTSNPEVIRLSIAHIVDYFDRNPGATSYSLCPDDNKEFCACADCTALDIGKLEAEELGGHPIISDRLQVYLNAVARGIQAKHPGKMVSSYAYQNYSTPPEREPVDPHVAIVFTTSVYCSAHSLGDPACESRQMMQRDLAGWAEACKNVYIYEYDPTPFNAELPWPMYGTHARAAAVYRDMGIAGFSYEGHNSWATLFPNFYVAARMMWDADADYEALMDEICVQFYGPAAVPMRKYFAAMDGAIRRFPEKVEWGQSAYPAIFTPEIVEGCRDHIQEAEGLAVDRPFKTRVQMTSMGFQYFDAYLSCRGAVAGGLSFEDYAAVRKRCDDRIDTMYALNKDYILADVARDYLDRELGQAVSKHYAAEMGLINQWMMIGPFENQGRGGHDHVLPPEADVDFSAVYTGKNGVEVGWFPFRGESWQGLIDLTGIFSPTDWTTIYAVCYVTSPRAQAAQFRIGSNDSVKAWLDGEEILDSPVSRGLNLDDDQVNVTLPEGTARVMLKVSNTALKWGFCFRITDSAGKKLEGLTVSLTPDGV